MKSLLLTFLLLASIARSDCTSAVYIVTSGCSGGSSGTCCIDSNGVISLIGSNAALQQAAIDTITFTNHLQDIQLATVFLWPTGNWNTAFGLASTAIQNTNNLADKTLANSKLANVWLASGSNTLLNGGTASVQLSSGGTVTISCTSTGSSGGGITSFKLSDATDVSLFATNFTKQGMSYVWDTTLGWMPQYVQPFGYCSVLMTNQQSVATGAKVPFNFVEEDDNGWWDSSNKCYSPPVSGLYEVKWCVTAFNPGAGNTIIAQLATNGVSIRNVLKDEQTSSGNKPNPVSSGSAFIRVTGGVTTINLNVSLSITSSLGYNGLGDRMTETWAQFIRVAN